jgi:uncharacterized membrane protein (UPF0127 family)
VGARAITVEREKGDIVCERCRLADTPWTRLRGLLGRGRLDADEGLLLRPVGAIHTFFMRFPIDVVFLDLEYVIVKVVHDVRPWRFAAARGAKAVLELSAGAAAGAHLTVGERLVPVPQWYREAA